MKKRPVLLSFALAFSLGFSLPACAAEDVTPSATDFKNVILVIGDGMGENHVENTLTYFGLESPAFLEDRAGSVSTRSANSLITDSAAAATAMATGQKVNNSSVGYGVDGQTLDSVSTLALRAGKRVGIVTTDALDGATPASFSSHAPDRGDSETIAKGQAQSGIDLFLGYASDGAYASAYADDFTNAGYDLGYAPEDLAAFADSEKLLCTLPNVRSEYDPAHGNGYQLKDMAAFALDFLENENGFFLMIEGAYIDKFSHSNEVLPALCEVRSLFDTISYLYETVGDDTAVLITADHETGRLAKASTREEISNNLYGSGGHTSANVPLYIKNFSLDEENVLVENTEIFELCKELLNV